MVHAHTVKLDKNYLNPPISGHFKGCSYNARATFNGVGTLFTLVRGNSSPGVWCVTLPVVVLSEISGEVPSNVSEPSTAT